MKGLFYILLFGCVVSDRQRRTITALLDLIDDYCDQEKVCVSDVTDDLILALSGDQYNEDIDSGMPREVVLWESIDERCRMDAACLENLFEDLRERVAEDPIELYDINEYSNL